MAQEEQEQKQEQKKQELQEHEQEEHELRELGARAARTAGGAGGAAEPSSMRTSETIRRGLHMSMREGGVDLLGEGAGRRREFCHSAAPPSPFSMSFNRDVDGVSANCQQNDSLANGLGLIPA